MYVVKADGTPLPVIKRGVERLKEKGIPINGVVISQVDLAKISSYGGDYYYQGYYDYYGYADTPNNSKSRRPRVKTLTKPRADQSLLRTNDVVVSR